MRLLLFLFAAVSPLHAQVAPARAEPPAPGAHVRIEVVGRGGEGGSSYRFTGTFLGSDSASLVLLGIRGDSARIGRQRIARLEMAAGTARSTGRGALAGALVGGAVLGVMSVASSTCGGDRSGGPSGIGDWSNFTCRGTAVSFAIGAAVGAPAGAIVGALVGSGIHHQRWKKVPLPAWPAVPPRPTASSAPLPENRP